MAYATYVYFDTERVFALPCLAEGMDDSTLIPACSLPEALEEIGSEPRAGWIFVTGWPLKEDEKTALAEKGVTPYLLVRIELMIQACLAAQSIEHPGQSLRWVDD